MRVDYSGPRRVRSRVAVENDQALLNTLLNTTPEQAEQWVRNNVNDLASAKTVLEKLSKAVVYLLQNQLDNEVNQ